MTFGRTCVAADALRPLGFRIVTVCVPGPGLHKSTGTPIWTRLHMWQCRQQLFCPPTCPPALSCKDCRANPTGNHATMMPMVSASIYVVDKERGGRGASGGYGGRGACWRLWCLWCRRSWRSWRLCWSGRGCLWFLWCTRGVLGVVVVTVAMVLHYTHAHTWIYLPTDSIPFVALILSLCTYREFHCIGSKPSAASSVYIIILPWAPWMFPFETHTQIDR